MGKPAACKPSSIAAWIALEERSESDPPRKITGYEYLGSFQSTGPLRVCDPCYLDKRPGGLLPMRQDVDGLPGACDALSFAFELDAYPMVPGAIVQPDTTPSGCARQITCADVFAE